MENWRRRIAKERGAVELEFPGVPEGGTSVRVKVYSAVELPTDVRYTLQERLKELLGQNAMVAFRTDASLFGGLLVQVGSKIIDMSVAGELRRLGAQVQQVIGAHLSSLAAQWAIDEDEALMPSHAEIAHYAETATWRVMHGESLVQ